MNLFLGWNIMLEYQLGTERSFFLSFLAENGNN